MRMTKLKISLILLLALTSVSCATAPVEIPNWDLAERPQTEVTDPIPLPDLCEIPSDGAWLAECWLKLDAFDIVASGNTDIAMDNAAALRKSDGSYDALLGAAKVQQELSQIRQDLLEQSRRAHKMDVWWLRGLVVIVGVGAAL